MPIHNRERFTQFDIPKDWYVHRPKGISAYIRTKGDERWIGPCVESILDFFDEIVVTFEDTGDRTVDILNGFRSPKISVHKYPFKLDPTAVEDSVHSGAYYTNWTVSRTSYSHVCHWDADMILIPEFNTRENRETILDSNIIRFSGYDVVTPDFNYISKSDRSDSPQFRRLADIRIYRVNKHLFTIWNEKLYLRGLQNPGKYSFNAIMDRFNYYGNVIDIFDPRIWKKYPWSQFHHLSNIVMRKDVVIPKPIYLHVKYLKEWKERYVTNANESTADPSSERGKMMPVEIPPFVFKTPEDYIHGNAAH
jgi:hypothetical protein